MTDPNAPHDPDALPRFTAEELRAMPLAEKADLWVTTIAANLCEKTATEPACLSPAEVLAAALAAVVARIRLEPCAMPSPRPYGLEGDCACFLVADANERHVGASTYVAVNRRTGEATTFESGE